ncbi:O-antigen ligase family protein [Candidatus Nucleicultrix amoebiphila]|jgi:O-antigen ligase|uniref:O-antigen ligase-related domain-containing protein n=1 Tax=Candidatus Nucleicultrix amoebiphila FS5 TaxID=1414854 RepID=A0A1W6N647_9PROT|nr:O-antigen ligase family protein [Candidatus Nucleicultrix amoebiphila]ARN85206.1 hypothetical protein GQ61_07825 [Candidatus Nucleicultrix amoebiphila FS5]
MNKNILNSLKIFLAFLIAPAAFLAYGKPMVILIILFVIISLLEGFRLPIKESHQKWLLILGAYTLISALWSPWPKNVFESSLHLLPLLFAVCIITDSTQSLRLSYNSLMVGLITLMLISVIDILSHGMITKIFTTYTVDKPWHNSNITPTITVIFCFFWPLFSWGVTLQKKYLSLLLGFFVFLIPWLTPHYAGRSALILGFIVFCIVWFFRRFAVICLGVVLMFYIIIAPFLSSTILQPQRWEKFLIDFRASGLHRLYIWEYVSSLISQRPLLGFGLSSSKLIPAGTNNPMGISSLPLHPHNGALQVWLELGAIGVIIFLVFLFIILKNITCIKSKIHQASAAAGLTTVFVFFSVSYGLWQSWWIATMGLTAFLFIQNSKPQQ